MKQLKKHYPAIVMGGYIIFLFFLLTTGTIRNYINPRLTFLTAFALIILCGMLVFTLRKTGYNHPEDSHHCHCCHHDEVKFRKSSLLLLLPILLSLTMAPQTLSYQPMGSASQPVNNNQTQPAPVAWQHTSPEKNLAPPGYEEYTQLNIGDTIFDKLVPPKQKLLSSKIFLQGMVLKSPKLSTDEIVVYRMVISCCAADGMPLGILVKLPENTNFKEGTWVGVEGTIKLLPVTETLKTIDPIAYMVPPEKTYPYFTSTKAYKLNAPVDEYLYP